jgi:hypothetical protein
LVFAKHARVILTVGVTTSTTFADSADTAPSFADICVGSHLKGVVTVSSGALAASSVTVLAPRPRRIGGIVTSVNDVSTASTCGASSGPGSFTVETRAHGRGIVTVEVTSSTTFADSADSAPSFADICVASHLKALGTLLSGTLTASSVSVISPRLRHEQGIVTSVNGSSLASTCGASASPGTFTVEPGKHAPSIVTVTVTTATTFTDSSDATPSFLEVCVGAHVNALVTLSSGTLTASSVSVLVSGHKPHASHHGRRSHGRR